MNNEFADGLAGTVRTAVTNAATTGLASFGAAAALAVGELAASAFAGRHAREGGDALAHEMTTAFAEDVRGRIAEELDADGLHVGKARVNTHLVAFACGERSAPVDDVAAERDFPFVLGAVAALEIAGAITLKAVCGFDATTREPKTSTETKIKLEFGWASEPRAEH